MLTGNQRAVSDDASCSTLYASCGAGMRPPGAPLLVRRLTGYWRTVVASSPLRFGVERRWRSCAHPPHLPSAAAAEDQLHAHQARGDRRPSALPPRPPASPSPGSPPACARSATAATRPPAASTPPATSSAARRRHRGAATLSARPPRRRGSAAPARSRRASSADRPRCPRPFASPCACSSAANPTSCPRTRPRSCPRSCEPSRHKSWRRRRRRPRKPTRARLWRVHAALTTSKQLSRCVRHQCALLELFKSFACSTRQSLPAIIDCL